MKGGQKLGTSLLQWRMGKRGQPSRSEMRAVCAVADIKNTLQHMQDGMHL